MYCPLGRLVRDKIFLVIMVAILSATALKLAHYNIAYLYIALAVAVLYIVCVMWGVNRTQINIADLMNCAPVSVATYYRKLRKDMNI